MSPPLADLNADTRLRPLRRPSHPANRKSEYSVNRMKIAASKNSGTAPLRDANVLEETAHSHAAAMRASRIVLLILAISFAVQVFSPLRLCTDSLVLLSMAQSAAQGSGFLDHGETTVFPPGYPALIAILLKAGIGHPWAIVALNAILCGIGLVCFYAIAAHGFVQSRMLVLNLCSWFLLSWVLIKHFCLPLTDIAFFAVSMLCLYAMNQAWKAAHSARFAYFVCAAWALSIAAILVRRIGVALIPALIYTVVFHRPRFKMAQLRQAPRLKLILAFAICAAALLVLGSAAASTSTLSDYTVDRAPVLYRMSRIFNYRLTELGELLLNVPSSRVPASIAAVFPIAGGVLLILLAGGMIIRRAVFGPIEVFLCGYAGILFVWPYYDARFWLPVVPLVFTFGAVTVERFIRVRMVRPLLAIYVLVFALLGAGAIVYSSRVTFAGARFPDRYGDDTLRPTYCLVFGSCADPVVGSKVKPKALQLLRTYR
jgi:hypothetical protein